MARRPSICGHTPARRHHFEVYDADAGTQLRLGERICSRCWHRVLSLARYGGVLYASVGSLEPAAYEQEQPNVLLVAWATQSIWIILVFLVFVFGVLATFNSPVFYFGVMLIFAVGSLLVYKSR